MYQVLLTIGDFELRSYGVIVAIAILLGVGVAHFMARQYGKFENHVLDMTVYVVIGAIIGARLWEVFFFQWGYYSKNLNEILMIWNGGLSIQGGLVGGFVTGIWYTRKHKIPFWEFADIVTPGIILGQAVGRIACFLNGDAFGSPTGSSFGLVYPEGTMAYATYGSQPLWPAEVMEGQWDLIVFAIVLILSKREMPKGYIFLTYNILYSFGRFMLEFLRGDTPRYLFNWTAAQWTSMIVILLALFFMYYLYTKKSPMNSSKAIAKGKTAKRTK
ncbi:prolipoprotein diacylglyceryl transferase [Microaerobacter geothermalis]|uniref:prolipoprotein diacylglyceryl transferase n=1 Tax=Microaerobacter geothermalis TaxID=674972 RepID=UPI001F3A44A1|nr:prolipoprotein diacylglyceryl transferase [Microaerobacter geothermalis]MCF6095170.1 prolipoprotein diacylglyceryl transferase [Microaerobacter geothermalis]